MEEKTDELSTQHTYKFCFKNTTGQGVDDLHVEFKKADIKVLNLGPFYSSSAKDTGSGSSRHTEADFNKQSDLPNNKYACVSFQSDKHHDFSIKKWYWTKLGQKVGGDRTDTPPQEEE